MLSHTGSNTSAKMHLGRKSLFRMTQYLCLTRQYVLLVSLRPSGKGLHTNCHKDHLTISIFCFGYNLVWLWIGSMTTAGLSRHLTRQWRLRWTIGVIDRVRPALERRLSSKKVPIGRSCFISSTLMTDASRHIGVFKTMGGTINICLTNGLDR